MKVHKETQREAKQRLLIQDAMWLANMCDSLGDDFLVMVCELGNEYAEALNSVSLRIYIAPHVPLVLECIRRLSLPEPDVVFNPLRQHVKANHLLTWQGMSGLTVLKIVRQYMEDERKLVWADEYFTFYGLQWPETQKQKQERQQRVRMKALPYIVAYDECTTAVITVGSKVKDTEDENSICIFCPRKDILDSLLKRVKQARLPVPKVVTAGEQGECYRIIWPGKVGLVILQAVRPYMKDSRKISLTNDYASAYGLKFTIVNPTPDLM